MSEPVDIWDDVFVSRRNAKRYSARWKVSIVFAAGSGRPFTKTLTHDLSLNGISVQSESSVDVGTELTVLLLPPSLGGEAAKIIRLKATVMLSIPFRGGFKLGMAFAHDAELEKLHAQLAAYDLSGDSLPSDAEGSALPDLS